ncbi:hypothetical protein CCR97_08300 [Rhodoplanes elegans]|uniref:Bacteriophage tail tape measure N-terminal domain-containing protein n=1 Tax=Rhodoplanes elegans TaxID=29408 RepID=A0A327KWF3_9BRAD|nr:phage tail length tape measure family protein [Rhodoplanes elegans]MBK5958119.1 hypothetical protein [Rhodoplanes elegans]MBK5958211.1 hypothetical protein [Rhodoplanes elegans]RAI41993.1 hypothetical protein CH338_01440 [Rhodoplanes elegans]
MELNAVRTLRVVGRSEGVDRVASDLRDVADAQQAVAVSSDTMTRRQTSAARSFAAMNAQVDPAVKAQQAFERAQRIADRALQQAVITQNEHARVMEQARRRYLDIVPANENLARSTGLAAHEMTNLGRQTADVFTMLAMGQSPFMTLVSQGPQVIDIFKSTKGSMAGFGQQIAALVTPARFAAGAVLAIGTAAAMAAMQYADAQREMKMALLGAGSASGATVSELNDIATTRSGLTGYSISEARALATELVKTGKIGSAAIGEIVSIGHGLEKFLGVSGPEAAKMMAESFADPVKGAQSLNERIGFLDAKTLHYIQTLTEQGDRQRAIATLTDALRPKIEAAEASTSKWARAWNAVANAAPDAYDAMGRGVDRIVSGPSTQEQISLKTIEMLDVQRRAMEMARNPASSFFMSKDPAAGAQARVAQLQAEIDALLKVAEAERKASEESQSRARSLSVQPIISALTQEVQQREELENKIKALATAMADPRFAEFTKNIDQAALAMQRAQGAVDTLLSPMERVAAQTRLGIDTANARGPNAQANIAARQKALELAGQELTTAERAAQIEGARLVSLEQSNRAIADAVNARTLSAQQSVETARLELDLVGKSAAEQEKMRGALQIRHQLEQEALQTYGNRDAYDKAHLASLLRQNEATAEYKRQTAVAQINDQIRFDRETAFLSSEDVQIAQQLKSIYPDVAAALNSSEAAAIRFNNSMKSIGDAGREAFGSIAQAMADGKITADEFSSVLTSLQSRLIQMAANKVWDGIFGTAAGAATGGAAGGGMFSWISGLFGSANGNVFAGGNIIPFERGGIVDRMQYFPLANGGIASIAEGNKPEVVMPLRRTPDGRMGVAATGVGGGGSTNFTFNVVNNSSAQVRVEEESDGRGGRKPRIVIDEMVAGSMRPGGAGNRSVLGALGARQRPRRMGA